MGNHLSSTHQTLLTSINIIIMILNSISALQINSTLDPSLIYTNNTPPSIIINPSNQTHPSNQTFNSTTPRSDLISCLKNIGDEILTPDSSPWSESIKTYNSRISPIPKLLISPRSIDSIIKTFDCARSFPGTRLSALGGGHSYTSLGMGGTNGAVVVEMKHFKELKLIKPDINHPLPSPLVRVGGGVLIRELINFLLKNGGLSFPHAKYTEVIISFFFFFFGFLDHFFRSWFLKSWMVLFLGGFFFFGLGGCGRFSDRWWVWYGFKVIWYHSR